MSLKEVFRGKYKVDAVSLRDSRAVRRKKARIAAQRLAGLDKDDTAYAVKYGDPLPGAEKRPAKVVRKTVSGLDIDKAAGKAWANVGKGGAPALRQQPGAGGQPVEPEGVDHGQIMGGESEVLK